MHEESSYEGLDLIECEVRRRTFWLLFGGELFLRFQNVGWNKIAEPELYSFSGQVHVHSARTPDLSAR